MGSFKGHALPGCLFLSVGLWHMGAAIDRYLAEPSSFRVRSWSPVLGFGGRFRYVELYLIAVGASLDLCIELFYSTHLKFFVNGILNPSHMNDYEHAGMLLMFVIFALIALLSEKSRRLSLPDGALALVAATAFSAEFLLFYFHSTTHQGLEGYYHRLLVFLIAACVISAVLGAFSSRSFIVDLSSGMAIALQGIWFYQTAFVLYGPLMPSNCKLIENEVKCTLPESEVRGKIFANFQLFTSVLVLFVAFGAAYTWAAARKPLPPVNTAEVELG